ncbi:iron chaperone [Gracilibacillus sp. S3-1-1]|uniref:Iron chaperone n=1 Tax=Gracilibacillus pellucidus TaxID=3095368 RepID=A0ACC6M6I0_9BACI|nr:iron chaperone [Gracilibacillus sp. S3-1-1]MDX8046501.1 iron chaperone [Gracilibacillus sp. S3-1-1]
MEVFADFLSKIENSQHRKRMEELFDWIQEQFPTLEPVIKWNQPMYTDHGTFIIGFSVAKHHMSVAPEQPGITRFTDQIEEAGYDYTKELIRIKWNSSVDYDLLEEIIAFNIMDKADCSTFWRK